ncbi:MAG: 2-amino-4-hydroxy-6-hydroxymethyldihydropteridine diphosphokinase [Candidatus Neomarinimicrobiota bacterium]
MKQKFSNNSREVINNLTYIGIGSNKGNRTNFLISAIGTIESNPECKVVAVSSVYETKPFGYKNQDNFLNAVIKITMNYSLLELFDFLKRTESELGRQTEIKWGPREIDLDILFFNDLIYTDENITIPHIGIMDRDFVLIPLSEIEPELIHPVVAKKISEIELPDTGSNIISKSDINVLVK